MYEHSNFYEAYRSDPQMVSQLNKFKDATCAGCGFYNIKRREFKLDPLWDEWSVKFVEDEIAKMKVPEVRKMIPMRGELTWTYVCEKCFNKPKGAKV